MQNSLLLLPRAGSVAVTAAESLAGPAVGMSRQASCPSGVDYDDGT
ncbi:hypothetical protein ACLH0K_17375 [Arthrobacter sp. MPF02]